MNTYKVEFKMLSERLKEKIDLVTNKYYDINGKIAFRIIIDEETVTGEVDAISEDSAFKYLSKENDEGYQPYYDIKIKLLKIGKTSPFEKLNLDYCSNVTSFKVIYSTFLKEEDSFCCDDVQERYSKLSPDEKLNYLNRPRYCEDF